MTEQERKQEIRKLLKYAENLTDPDLTFKCSEKFAQGALKDIRKCLSKSIAILKEPCGTCGGSWKKLTPGLRLAYPCPDCQPESQEPKDGWRVPWKEPDHIVEKVEPERLLRDLLALIHRDGGQHSADVGLYQSAQDARSKIHPVEKPECKTCNGTKLMPTKMPHDKVYWGNQMPCKDCKDESAEKPVSEEDCAMWSMVGTKVYKKCAQVYKLEAKLEAETKRADEAEADKELWKECTEGQKVKIDIIEVQLKTANEKVEMLKEGHRCKGCEEIIYYQDYCKKCNRKVEPLEAKLKESQRMEKEYRNYTQDLRTKLKDTRAKLKEQAKEIERLKQALKIYGHHSRTDDTTMCEHMKHSDYPCTCGLEQALKGGG